MIGKAHAVEIRAGNDLGELGEYKMGMDIADTRAASSDHDIACALILH